MLGPSADQGLARDAGDVDAGAADHLRLDHGGALAGPRLVLASTFLPVSPKTRMSSCSGRADECDIEPSSIAALRAAEGSHDGGEAVFPNGTRLFRTARPWARLGCPALLGSARRGGPMAGSLPLARAPECDPGFGRGLTPWGDRDGKEADHAGLDCRVAAAGPGIPEASKPGDGPLNGEVWPSSNPPLVGQIDKATCDGVCVASARRPSRGWVRGGAAENRHVKKAALSAMTVRTDRKDARGIARLLRMGWSRPVHRRSAPAQHGGRLLSFRGFHQRPRAWHSAAAEQGLSTPSGHRPRRATEADPGDIGLATSVPAHSQPRRLNQWYGATADRTISAKAKG